MKRLICEIIDEFIAASTRQEKISVLRSYDTPRLRQFFKLLYGPAKFDVDIPPYRPAPEPLGMTWTCLEMEIPKLHRFMEGNDISPERKRSLLIGLLESLYKDEAKILEGLIKKDLGIKYLTPKIIKEAFEGINI